MLYYAAPSFINTASAKSLTVTYMYMYNANITRIIDTEDVSQMHTGKTTLNSSTNTLTDQLLNRQPFLASKNC